jgi:hypothetical protein
MSLLYSYRKIRQKHQRELTVNKAAITKADKADSIAIIYALDYHTLSRSTDFSISILHTQRDGID